MVALVLLFFSGLLALLPNAARAGIVANAVPSSRSERATSVATASDVVQTELNRQTLQRRAIVAATSGMPIVSANAMRKNADRSADICIGPRPLAGKETNWDPDRVRARSGPYFRLYGPEKTFLSEKTWKLPDIEHVD